MRQRSQSFRNLSVCSIYEATGANQDAIATAGQMGIDPNMSAAVALNEEGTSASAFSIGRKIRSMRVKSSLGDEDADYHKPMSEIVQEEEGR
ncbi:MAG: hypothetical protein ACK57I_03995 [Akkermansiaceae bacterium]|jgi:hypothetical protein